ncbi:hypothetical protein ACLOAV_000659 [Pseudogymnoascus australis]
MDPVQVLRNFYLLASTLLVSVNVVPSLQQRFLKYGPRATKVKDEHGKPVAEPESSGRLSQFMDMLASLGVPHSWFTHFYIASVASSVFWAIQVARKGLIFRYLAELHLDNSVNEPSMSIDQVVLVWALMTIQGSRRLYECIALSKPSTSKMGAAAYLLGVVFYLAMGVVVWIEGIRKKDAYLPHNINLLIVKASILANDISFQSLATMIQPSVKTAIGVPLFLLGSIAQNTCHTYLASLKKYSLPEEGLFRGIISPHYTSECVIYLGLAIAGAPPGQPLNKTIATVIFFEAINLGITAETTRVWYSEKFGAKSIEGRWRIFPIGPNVEVTGTKDAEGETGADNLNQIHTATDPDVATMEPAEPTKSPPGVDAPGTTESATPLGIKSSPPPLPVPAQARVSTPNVDSEGDATPASGSDSEAETVVLPGADGYSPSKIRKERKIKLEDKTNENGDDNNMDIDVDTDKDPHISQVDVKEEEGQNWNEGAASLLGKRKRSKHGSATRPDDNHTGNSSGLSSVPTSPAARSLPAPSKRTGSEPIRSRSQSPSVPGKQKGHAEQVNNESGSEREKDNRRPHKRRNSNGNNSGKQTKNSPTDGTPQHHRTESPSPTRHNNTSATSGAANGLSHKKKAIPTPLRSTKDNHPTDYQSDASSNGESPYPRRSRTRNLGTPPTGDLAHPLAKMPPHRRRPDRYGRTPLTDACEDGDYDKAKHLLAEYPEDLDQPDAARNTPLQCASLNGHEDIVQMLLQNGCNIHCKNDLGDSPLLDAVENGHLEVIKLLLGAGVDPRARNKLGEEPIMKINKDDDDADAIREALLAARSTYAQARPSATSQTPQAETSDSRNRRTMSHGRSNRTGQHQLYTPLNVISLRTAAAKGDLQTVGMIAAVLEEGLDDAESLIAAAKGGHDDVLQILLAVGNANPDPSPIPGSWEYSTPMLAAIGGENIKVIELLLSNIDDGRFNPTKTYRGRTYFEIAKERAGPLWEEEEKLLKGAFDNYKSPARSGRSGHSNNQPSRSHRKKISDASDRPNGSKDKHEAGDNAVRDQKALAGHGLGSPGRKSVGRSKEGGEAYDRESIASPTQERKRSELDRTVSPSESEPAKPRRKLVSGRDLKGGREKQKSSALITSPPGVTSAGADDDKLDAAGRKKNLQRSDSKAASDTATERARSAKREKSTDRMSIIRAQSPTKRPRTSSTPPSESQEASNKRRRLESESKGLRRSESVRGTSPNHRKPIPPPRSDSLMQKPSSKEQRMDPGRKESQKLPGKPPLSGDSRQPTNDSEKVSSHKEGRPRPTEGVPSARSSQEADQKTASAEEVAAIAKKKAQKEAREAMEAEREKAEREKAEREKAEQEKVKREKAEREVKIKKEEDERIEKERAEEAKRHVEEARIAREAAEKRKREEQAKRAEEDAKRAKEEAELQEQQRREEAEAQRRAEEERKHKLEEQQRIQREEAERRRAAHIAEQRAERLRLMKEKEAARLARLPPLLQWFDGLPYPAKPEVAVKFKLMQGVRYDTIVPEATGEPDGREQWLLNTQVALLLGEKDLQLSRYTAWERVSASLLAKQGLWRVESDMYSMVRADLRPFNPLLAENPFQTLSPTAADAMRKAAMPLFLDLDLFFVKVADLMFIAPSIPHLRNLQLDVQYHEALPDESWLGRLAAPAKWTEDPDCESYLGFTPGTKSYVNGDLGGVGRNQEGEPEYEDLARQQDLEDGEVNGEVVKEGANGHADAEKSEGEALKKEESDAGVTNGVGANGIM